MRCEHASNPIRTIEATLSKNICFAEDAGGEAALEEGVSSVTPSFKVPLVLANTRSNNNENKRLFAIGPIGLERNGPSIRAKRGQLGKNEHLYST